jgi:hypothetical protein
MGKLCAAEYFSKFYILKDLVNTYWMIINSRNPVWWAADLAVLNIIGHYMSFLPWLKMYNISEKSRNGSELN